MVSALRHYTHPNEFLFPAAPGKYAAMGPNLNATTVLTGPTTRTLAIMILSQSVVDQTRSLAPDNGWLAVRTYPKTPDDAAGGESLPRTSPRPSLLPDYPTYRVLSHRLQATLIPPLNCPITCLIHRKSSTLPVPSAHRRDCVPAITCLYAPIHLLLLFSTLHQGLQPFKGALHRRLYWPIPSQRSSSLPHMISTTSWFLRPPLLATLV